MTAQPPLSLAPAEATLIGAAAGLVEDAEGGRVWLHGNLWLSWESGDEVTRRLAATQLVRTKACSAVAVAHAFGVHRETLRRWMATLTETGAAGLVSERRGPKGPSRVRAEVVAEITARRAAGASLRTIASVVGVSVTSVRRALAEEPTTQEPAADEAEGLADEVEDVEGVEGSAGGGGPAAVGGAVEDEAAAGLPVLADPPARFAERGLARWGLLGHAVPVFTGAGRVPLAGLLLALPGLAATGLLECAGATYGSLPNGFYGLDTVLVEAVLRTLAGEPRAEGATRVDPVALGRVLGLDRAPEVKTIRRRIAQLAGAGKAEELIAAMARHHLDQAAEGGQDLGAVLYVDGHVRAYQGTRKVAKTHLSRLRFPAPATVENWVTDAAGDPVMVVMAEPGASLAGELRRLLPQLRQAVGDDRRVLVGFDRGGWSPALFAEMDAAGFDVLTWRKGHPEDLPSEEFSEATHVDEHGATRTFTLAETDVELPLDDGGSETFGMHQVTRRDTAGKQVHILTTRVDLPAAEVVYRMGSRWRIENYFRYARAHFDLDSHDSYTAGVDDPARSVPNPAKKHAHKQVLAARARYDRARAATDQALLGLRSPKPGHTAVITNTDHDRVTAGLRAATAALDAAQATHRGIPARLPLAEVNPGQQVLEVETKLITHAVKIAAFNTATALARDLRIHTGYARADDEAHTLARQVLTHSGDIDPNPDHGVLTIRLDPMPTSRATAAVAELCQHLTDTKTRYPGTNLTLRYKIKKRR
ncbi:MAG TPA: helix-turn-helix domain-containing protein [Dermatophilaceae bacterium]|nr:helix-turn-helix domain-containing protein [Dermatophilaceae bacterium]